MEQLYRKEYHSARMMNKTFRLIDDITVINSDGVFATLMKYIYPMSLELNKENFNDNSANVLDLKINVEDGNFNVNLNDKRQDFPFEIIQFSVRSSNVLRCI